MIESQADLLLVFLLASVVTTDITPIILVVTLAVVVAVVLRLLGLLSQLLTSARIVRTFVVLAVAVVTSTSPTIVEVAVGAKLLVVLLAGHV